MVSDPIHVISLGAGVQSSTLALMAAAGDITPMPVAAIFADTKGEPKAVYEWLDKLSSLLPFPVERVCAGSLQEKSLAPYYSRKNRKIAIMGLPAHTTDGIMMRQCTSQFKTHPINKVITSLMKRHKTRRCVKWIGISLDEAHRMKPSWRPNVTHRWPLVDLRMKRWDCLLWMERHGYPKPPKSACFFCPFQSNRQWKGLSPEEFMAAVRFERELQDVYQKINLPRPYLHPSKMPLEEVDFRTDEDHGQGLLFGNECEGHCGV